MNDLAGLLYGSPSAPPAQAYAVPPSPQPAAMPLPEAAAPVAQSVAAPVVQAPAPEAQPLTPIDAQSTPEEKQGFFDRMRTDPNLRQSILMTGLTMMQPRGGEDTMGLVGRSIMAGNMTKNFLDQNAVEDTRRAEELATQQDFRKTQTAAAKQTMEQKAAEFPQTMRKLQIDIDNAATDGEKKKAEAAMKVFESDPKRMAEKFDLDREATRANITQSRAAAGASSASARANNALTDERTLGTSVKRELLDPKTTPERKAQIRAMYTADDAATNQQADKEARTKALIKEANPDWTDQQVSARALEMIDPTNMKGQEFQTLRELLRNAETDDEIREIKGKMNALLAKAENSRNPKAVAGATAGIAKTISEAEIQQNMTKYKWTREQTLAKAKELGYTLQGAK